MKYNRSENEVENYQKQFKVETCTLFQDSVYFTKVCNKRSGKKFTLLQHNDPFFSKDNLETGSIQ